MAITPFSKQDLLPQEEKLEITKHKSELFIGIPKETSYQERRICLTPDAVNALTSNGHKVLIECEAGENANYSDKEYSDAGAEITNDTQKVLSCPMILKVEPATIEEIQMMNIETIIISAIQLKTRKKEYFEALQKKKIKTVEGIYLGLLGPSFETPAEVKLYSKWGMGSVGMSTVWETIALRHCGAKVGGLSLVANPGAGLVKGHVLTHEEVEREAKKVSRAMVEALFDSAQSIFNYS